MSLEFQTAFWGGGPPAARTSCVVTGAFGSVTPTRGFVAAAAAAAPDSGPVDLLHDRLVDVVVVVRRRRVDVDGRRPAGAAGLGPCRASSTIGFSSSDGAAATGGAFAFKCRAA